MYFRFRSLGSEGDIPGDITFFRITVVKLRDLLAFGYDGALAQFPQFCKKQKGVCSVLKQVLVGYETDAVGHGGRDFFALFILIFPEGYLQLLKVFNDCLSFVIKVLGIAVKHLQYFVAGSQGQADEIDPANTDLELTVNGELRQKSNTRFMMTDVYELVSRISHVTPIEPGDLIGTVTPEGVGGFMNPPRYLASGDVIRATVHGIGTIENEVT